MAVASYGGSFVLMILVNYETGHGFEPWRTWLYHSLEQTTLQMSEVAVKTTTPHHHHHFFLTPVVDSVVIAVADVSVAVAVAVFYHLKD